MPRKTPITPREQVVAKLSARIRSGQFETGDRLDGESRLATEFDVSRGTVRQALAELQRQGLITTRAGLGSFITFDGTPLDAGVGWARALADSGSSVTTQVLSIDPVAGADMPALPGNVELAEGIAVRRVRRLADGTGVSYECSTVPAVGILADLPAIGLVEGSLASSLRAAGLIAVRGTQTVDVRLLDDRHAAILAQDVGTPFLRTTRTALDAVGQLVEHVESHLDPNHFQLQLQFGDEA